MKNSRSCLHRIEKVNMTAVFVLSAALLAIAALVGIVMNAILPGKDYEFGVNEQGDTSVNFGTRND